LTETTRPQQLVMTVGEFITAILGGILGGVALGLAALATGDREALFIALVVGQYLGHLGAIWLLLRRRRASFSDLGLIVEPVDVVFVLAGIALQIGLAVVFAPMAQLLGPDEPAQAVAEEIQRLQTSSAKLIMAGAVALIAPVTEELLFRGMLLRTMVARRGVRLGLFLTSVVFALFHLAGSAGNTLRAAILILPLLTVVGWVLGRLALSFRRLGPAVFVHAGFNLLALLTLLAPPELLSGAG
jgi:hypothetical protein